MCATPDPRLPQISEGDTNQNFSVGGAPLSGPVAMPGSVQNHRQYSASISKTAAQQCFSRPRKGTLRLPADVAICELAVRVIAVRPVDHGERHCAAARVVVVGFRHRTARHSQACGRRPAPTTVSVQKTIVEGRFVRRWSAPDRLQHRDGVQCLHDIVNPDDIDAGGPGGRDRGQRSGQPVLDSAAGDVPDE